MDRKKNVMAKNVIWLMIISIVFKLVGFVNRAIVVAYYGATTKTDAFFAVTGFVEGLAAIILAGVTVGIVNIYISERSKNNNADTIISTYLFIFLVALTFVSLCIILFAEQLSIFLLPVEGVDYDMVSYYLKLSASILPFQGIITVYGAVLQAEDRFTPVKSTGLISSLVSILVIIALNAIFKEKCLLISFIAGYVINALLLFFCGKKYVKIRSIDLSNHRKIKELFLITGPLIVGSAALEVNLFLDKVVSASLGEGVVTALSCAKVLYLALEGVFIQNVVMVIFPNFTKLVHRGEYDELIGGIRTTILVMFSILLPISVIIFMHSNDLVNIAYGRGTFSKEAVLLTSSALVGYVLGLIPLAIRDVFLKVCYALKNSKLPMVCSIISMALNIILDLVLVRIMGVMGVALATAIAHFVSAFILYIYVKREIGFSFKSNNNDEFIKIVLSNIVSIVLAYLVYIMSRNFIFSIMVYILVYVAFVYFTNIIGVKDKIKVICHKK